MARICLESGYIYHEAPPIDRRTGTAVAGTTVAGIAVAGTAAAAEGPGVAFVCC